MLSNEISVCVTIHNQEPIIGTVMESIVEKVSEHVKEIICVFDGCTDRSLAIAYDILMKNKIPFKIFEAPDLWETRCNNLTFRESSCPYILTIQDDMALLEANFDQQMLKPFYKVPNLLGATARNAQDEYMEDGKLLYCNVAGQDVKSPRGVLYIRDIIVRGPILFDHAKLAEMNYLDEAFAPIYADDYDLSFRAWKEKGYVVGAFRAGYISPDAWGMTRKHSAEKHAFWYASAMKNEKQVMERHADVMGGGHSQDIQIE